jgi:polar amino acid transport system permease protein
MNGLDYFFIVGAWPKLARGLVVTLQLTLWVNVIGLIAGFLVALMLKSGIAAMRILARGYVDFFRCTPTLVQIVWFFFCVPMLFHVFWPPVFSGIVILSMNLTAFNAEAFRSAIQAIPTAQTDAAVALGLDPPTRIIYVILPQATRYAVPVLITNAIGLFQQTSLLALVGVQELMYDGKLLSTQTYRPIETYTFLALFYLAVSVPFGRLTAYLEYRSERRLRT